MHAAATRFSCVVDSFTIWVQREITITLSESVPALESSRMRARPSPALTLGINLMMNLPSATPSSGRSRCGKCSCMELT